ncbi:nuclease [Candidatus Falkowbacteria bacterium CG10_big_fil_rev_8_21_14_0_10_44_15]|uniref:Nuclease n=1 Tax=Candidatus Falkowbacteria bacterium CG10_big_fil_rev_8_21_14_0_10_44_15 TaxID=1974569 RepID=A0A2H0UZS1_9BACT|nr:MAG: nuclease [Candidatus Falkowbacteria bacterium CG10_big_fil_rev_8_21_14_0_10_44_15]
MKKRGIILFSVIIILLAVILIINRQTLGEKNVLGGKLVNEQPILNSEREETSKKEDKSIEERNLVKENIQYPISNVSAESIAEGGSRNQNKSDYKQYYLVTRVIDGDTIDVNSGTTTERVRLIGINTPEVVDPRKPVECFGREASQKAHEFLENQAVYLEPDETQDERDKYGRLLRYAWRADGVFYNWEIIKQGYAYEYTYFTPYKYQAEFRQAETLARDHKLGLWADNACTVANNLNASTPTASALPSNPNCNIKGNIASDGEKIYHLPSCDYYAKTMINLGQGELYFCSEEEAVAAGWRKAQNCE